MGANEERPRRDREDREKRKERPVDEPMEAFVEEEDPEDLPREERPFEAGKDARRPPREEETPVRPGPPPNAPRARDQIGGRSSTNR